MIYDIDITDRIIGGLRQQSTIIQHNVGVDHICPHFDAEWEGFAISAIFKKPAKGKLEELKFSMEAADGGLTVVPWELLDDTRPIQLAFVGIKGDERLVTLFSAATLEVRESGEITGVTPKDPTIDQIEALVAEAQKTVDEAKQSVTDIQGVIDQGKQAVEDAAKAVGDAQTALSNAESATEAATASAQAADVAAASANEAAQGATDAAERATKATASANDAAESANAAADRATETDGSVKAAETLRAQAESGRVEAESARAQAEEQRLASESERVDKEAERQAAEKVRESNETTRTEAETARVSAEEKRAEDHAQHNKDQEANNLAQAKNNADQAANNQAAMGLQFKVLKVGEYDPATLEPTVEGASGLFYLVPQEGEENDLYAEWIYVEQDARFERVGNTAVTIEPVTTGQIDQVVDEGADLQGENTLTATGLAYYDKKRKAANDALYATREDIPSDYITAEDLAPYATTESVESGLSAKADAADLADYATKTQIETEVMPNLLPERPMDENMFLNGMGEWKDVKGGGAGPIWLEVDGQGDLYAYYDDSTTPPDYDYEEESGDLYVIFETEE